MLQQLLPLLPKDASTAANIAMFSSVLFAIAIWMVGARCSRGIITLGTVALGGALGMLAPRIFNWDINSMATAVGGAMLFGLSGFVLHRVWVGVGLGLVFALWAAVAVWLAYRNGATFTWPQNIDDPRTFAAALWSSFPEDMRRILPYVAGSAAIIGLAATLLWPRIGTVTLYSVVGVSLLTAMTLWAIQSGQLEWPRFLPAQPEPQVILLAGFVVIGALIQWQIAMCPSHPRARAQPAT